MLIELYIYRNMWLMIFNMKSLFFKSLPLLGHSLPGVGPCAYRTNIVSLPYKRDKDAVFTLNFILHILPFIFAHVSISYTSTKWTLHDCCLHVIPIPMPCLSPINQASSQIQITCSLIGHSKLPIGLDISVNRCLSIQC